MVGYSDDDHGGLWGHGAEDLSWHVRWSTLCSSWRAHDSLTRACHSIQLLHVLLPHPGKCMISLFHVILKMKSIFDLSADKSNTD